MTMRSGSPRLGMAVTLIALTGLACAPEKPAIDTLIAQLGNRVYRYADDPATPCARTPFGTEWFRVLDPASKYHAAAGAARCLGHMGPDAAAAVPALIDALRRGPNDYDTGDGVIPARSAIAAALGAIGDPRAIDPLAEALRSAVPADRGAGALPAKEPAAQGAIVEALGRFGPAAAGHLEPVAALLRARAADTTFVEARREAFEQAEATRIAIEELRRRDTTQTSFEVPPQAITIARRRLDRTSAAYIRDLEVQSVDIVASAAARALGRFGRREGTPALVAGLRFPPAAEASATALGDLGAAPPGLSRDLHAVFTAPATGPATRRAIARLMGKVLDGGSVPLLARGLADPAISETCAEALEAFGPRADVALPQLYAVAQQPSLADTAAHGLVWGLEATQRLGNRVAAVHTIETLGGRKAVQVLAPYWQDPDIGSAIRRILALRRR